MRTTSPAPARIIKRDQLKIHETTPAVNGEHTVHPAPNLQLIRADGAVRAVRIDCVCGRAMEIELVLDRDADPTMNAATMNAAITKAATTKIATEAGI
ncbi:MAG: hypothetical protein ACKVS6_02085 [Planctomycetota bacterium]